MNTKDLLAKYHTYLMSLTDRLAEKTPKKHEHRPKEYREYLVREISSVKGQIDRIKLEEQGK